MGKKTQEQTTLFDSLEEEYSTPVLLPEEQKAGTHGWCVRYARITNSLDWNAPPVLLQLIPRRVLLKRDTWRDERGWWQQWADSDDGKPFIGWTGGSELLFKREPSVGDMLKIALKECPDCKGLPYEIR